MNDIMYVCMHVSPSAAPAELSPPRMLLPPPPAAPLPLGDVEGPIPKKEESLEEAEGGGVGTMFPLSVLVTGCGLKP
jgi:hypothetical protein